MGADSENKVGSVLVAGAGIGGMQAALDLAESGIKVYLTDNKACIGGVMSQLDKTFPTNDCAMCTMAPRLVEIGRHKDIEIITLAEIEDIEGVPGNFNVRLRKKARYIDEAKCTGCGECAEKCPVEIPSSYNAFLNTTKAVYRRYPQAIPNYFAIEKTGRAPCSFNCPAGQRAQGYVALINEKRYEDAFKVIRKDNPFPSVCGRVCVHRCEDECTRKQVDDPVSIMALKRFVADWAFENMSDTGAPGPGRETGSPHGDDGGPPKYVAVIGSGPAGLTAAGDLRMMGHKVTVYEALPVAGGMMRVGIPEYRLPRERLEWDIKNILAGGIELKTGKRIDSIKALLDDGHDAVFVATGTHRGYKLNVPGEETSGVIDGIDFLRRVNLGDKVEIGQNVAVIGGGNTAIDAARVAARLGKNVTILYRRTRAEMPAEEEEIDEALHEGIKIEYLTAPIECIDKNGTLVSVECVKMELGDVDASGRRRPVPIKGSNFKVPADTLITAIGQEPDHSFSGDGIELTGRGTVKVDPGTMASSMEGVFAGGDVVTGPSYIIDAIAAGHTAARSIDRYLKGLAPEPKQKPHAFVELTPEEIRMRKKSSGKRNNAPIAPDDVRKGFSEVQLGYTEEQALAEAARCLGCGICSECLICEENCEVGAVDHEMPSESYVDLNVGAVVLSPGFELLSGNTKLEYGYWNSPNVVTALEFERILSSTGPFSGSVLRPSDKRHPEKIAFIQCVASRDRTRNYCSAVCCMYATKESIIAKEHSEEELDCHIYYMDIRAFGKGFEEYYERAKALGVKYIRCRPSAIEEIEDNRLMIHYIDENGKLLAEDYDMVVLSMGMEVPDELRGMCKKLGIRLNEHGFCETDAFNPAQSSREGVFVCGPFTEPKDIPETVMQASSAASQARALLADVSGTLITPKEFPPEKDVTGQPPRAGVFICHCGRNIAGVVNIPELLEYVKTIPGVVYAADNLYTCSNDTQDRIKELIEEYGLNRVIVASCTPRTHEPLFRNTVREAGLNPYLFEMTNIRDQCSWVHMFDPEGATRKAKDLLRMAVAKASLLEPLYSLSIPVLSGVLVIGGGLAGMTAAINLAEQGFEVNLVEKENELGGNLRSVRYLIGNGRNPQDELRKIIENVNDHRNINVWTGTKLESVDGFIGNFKTKLSRNGSVMDIEHGAVIVATGATLHVPEEYMYGKDERVITQLDLEEVLDEGGFNAKRVVMIQCVGSREGDRMYCSRICCSQAIKNALKIKEKNPDTEVYVLYREIMSYGLRESYYTEARRKGVKFIRYDLDHKPVATSDGDKLMVETGDPVLGRKLRIPADLLVLAPALVPRSDTEDVAKMLKLPLTKEKFFLEAHMKLRPVDFSVSGVFLAGLAHSPKNIDETILQAQAAASRAVTIISKPDYTPEAVVSSVDEEVCAACGICVSICNYSALEIVTVRGKRFSHINKALCKSCGACASACPSGAVQQLGFKTRQIVDMIGASME